MIELIPDWRCEHRAGGLVLVPPEGAGCGTIRYREQVRPLRRVVDVVRELPVPADYELDAVGDVDPLVTVEGEHAALVTVSGRLAGQPVERTIGVVVCDDWYSLTIGLARRPDQFARFRDRVRDLVEHDTFMMGVRRRRFVHASPPGWHGMLAGPLHALWLPLDHPRNGGALSIYPALPTPEGARDHAEAFVGMYVRQQLGGARVEVRSPALVTSASRLSGTRWELAGAGDCVHDLLVLEDDRYIYPLALRSPAADRTNNLDVLLHVADTVQPIPRPLAASRAIQAEALAHWVD